MTRTIVFIATLATCFACGAGLLLSTENTGTTASCTYSGSWEEIYTYGTSGAVLDGLPQILKATNGDIWIVGATSVGGVTTWHVQKSTDSGLNFSEVSTFTPLDATKKSFATGITQDSNGNLIIVGESKDSSNLLHWIAVKSTDNGATWTVSDNYTNSGNGSTADGVASDSNGNVYAVGKAPTTSPQFMLVRKLENGQSTWTDPPIHSFNHSNFNEAAGKDVYVDSSGAIYASAELITAGPPETGAAYVARSSDGGSTWAVLTSGLQHTDTTDVTKFETMLVDSSGHIYLGGTIDNVDGAWLVQRSTDNGASFADSDTYLPGSSSSTVMNMMQDAAGNIRAVGGSGGSSSNEMYWVVRTGTTSGSTLSWVLSENYINTTGKISAASGITMDQSNNILVSGVVQASNDETSWAVRRLKCNP